MHTAPRLALLVETVDIVSLIELPEDDADVRIEVQCHLSHQPIRPHRLNADLAMWTDGAGNAWNERNDHNRIARVIADRFGLAHDELLGDVAITGAVDSEGNAVPLTSAQIDDLTAIVRGIDGARILPGI